MSNDQALALIKSVSDAAGKIDVPKLQQLLLKQQGPSAMAGVHDDAAYRAQQQSADANLNDVINSGGLTLADRAALNKIQQRTASTEAAGRNAITAGAAARGTLDSGSQLAAELANQQNSAENLNQQGENTAGAAQSRAYAAIAQRGQNAASGLQRTQQLAEAKAQAQDAINAGNTAIANTAAKYNAGLPQQDFQNQLGLLNAKAAPIYATAGMTAANGQNTAKNIQGAGNLAGAALNKMGSGSSANGYTPPPNTQAGDPQYGSPTDWNAAPGAGVNGGGASAEGPGTPNFGDSSDSLSGQSTKPARQKTIVGYDDNNQPIYGYASAS